MHRRSTSDSAVLYKDYTELAVIHEHNEESAAERICASWRDAERCAHERAVASIRLPAGAVTAILLFVSLLLGLLQLGLIVAGDQLSNTTPIWEIVLLQTNASFNNGMNRDDAWYAMRKTWEPTRVWCNSFAQAGKKLDSDGHPSIGLPTLGGVNIPDYGIMPGDAFEGFVYPNGTAEEPFVMPAVATFRVPVPTTMGTVGDGPRYRHGVKTLQWKQQVIHGEPVASGLDQGAWYDIVGPANDTVGRIFIAMTYELVWAGNGYCEHIRAHSVLDQPANSYSNAVFFVVGIHAAAVGVQDMLTRGNERRSIMEDRPLASIAAGLVLLYAGASSFCYHALLSESTESADMAGVFALATSATFYCAFANTHERVAVLGLYGLTVFFVSVLGYITASTKVIVLCATLVAVAHRWWWVRRQHVAHRWACAAFVLIVFAFGARQSDETVCTPDSAFQMHAAWHAFTAASVWCIWVFFRSEPCEL